MPDKCVAFGCNSGYDGHKPEGRISFHSFHRNPDSDLCKKWIRANPRKDFEPGDSVRMYSLHFRDCDFVDEHSDSNPRRRRKYKSTKLARRYLKKDAVPSIFPNAPPRLSSPLPTHEHQHQQQWRPVVDSRKHRDWRRCRKCSRPRTMSSR